MSFSKRPKDIHREVFEGTGSWKELKCLLMAVYQTIPCAALAFADYALNIHSNVRPVKLA